MCVNVYVCHTHIVSTHTHTQNRLYGHIHHKYKCASKKSRIYQHTHICTLCTALNRQSYTQPPTTLPYAYIHMYIHIRTYVHISTYIHTYIITFTYTHTSKHTYIMFPLQCIRGKKKPQHCLFGGKYPPF